VTWVPPPDAAQPTWDGQQPQYIGTDGIAYSGRSQNANRASSYAVEVSTNGGIDWTRTNCQISCSDATDCRCDLTHLEAGTPVAVRVHSVAGGGFSAPSALALTRTEHSGASAACAQQLTDEMNGNFLSTGSTVAIVIGVLAGASLLILLVWMFVCGGKEYLQGRMSPPPPPPPGGKPY